MGRSFRDLDVWRKAIDLTACVYEFTKAFPREETYGLTGQMRRAAVSVASNVAQGSARGTLKDFRQFVKLAKGSNCELQTQLIISRRLGLGSEDRRVEAEQMADDVSRMLSGLSDYLARKIRADRSAKTHTT